MTDLTKLVELAKSIDWGCELCGSKYRLVNHHISYVPERILVVCVSCHTKIHFTPFEGVCPQISAKDYNIVKRLLFPAKIDQEKLDGKWDHITNRLDLYKEPELLKEEGKGVPFEELKQLMEEKPIL